MNLQLILFFTIIVAAATVNGAKSGVGCYKDNGKGAKDYEGTIGFTTNYTKCQAWTAKSPHKHGYTKDPNNKYFPEDSVADAKNYCRNPSRYKKGPWCYTNKDEYPRWMLCDIPKCCKSGQKGFIASGKPCTGCYKIKSRRSKHYSGTYSYTVSGRRCQAWTAQSPHKHSYSTKPEKFPEDSVADAKNYCRNPSGYYKGFWCYTTDPNKRWELCDIPRC